MNIPGLGAFAAQQNMRPKKGGIESNEEPRKKSLLSMYFEAMFWIIGFCVWLAINVIPIAYALELESGWLFIACVPWVVFWVVLPMWFFSKKEQ